MIFFEKLNFMGMAWLRMVFLHFVAEIVDLLPDAGSARFRDFVAGFFDQAACFIAEAFFLLHVTIELLFHMNDLPSLKCS